VNVKIDYPQKNIFFVKLEKTGYFPHKDYKFYKFCKFSIKKLYEILQNFLVW